MSEVATATQVLAKPMPSRGWWRRGSDRNAIEYAKDQLEQKHADHIKALEADREAKIKVVEDRLTKKFDDEVRELNRAYGVPTPNHPTVCSPLACFA